MDQKSIASSSSQGTHLARREFLVAGATLSVANLLSSAVPINVERAPKFKAVAFDAFPIFDPKPVSLLAEQLFPGHGLELFNLWRIRQFEYTWLRTLSRQYVDFQEVTADALVYATKSLRLELDTKKRVALVRAYSNLQAWPDVLPALKRLRAAGVRLGFLSNFTREMLESNIRTSGIEGFFEHMLSTDQVRVFKPAPQAYAMALDAFNLEKAEVVFAAFAGWDAAGAKSFGYPTFWVNRQNAIAEELNAPADAAGDLAALVEFVLPSRR